MITQFKSEFEQCAELLEKHYGIFYSVISMGFPRLTDEIPTAAVSFNKYGNFIEFLFNEKFWNSIDSNTRCFVISHECLHVLLSHGLRLSNKDPQIANIAMDIVVNHMLVNKFGYNRSAINNEEKLAWIDTVFKDTTGILPDQTFEYYYDKITKDIKNTNITVIQSIDCHSFKSQSGSESESGSNGLPTFTEEANDKIASEAEKNNSPEIIKKFAETVNSDESANKTAGTVAGKMVKNVSVTKPKKLRKWETVIKKWCTTIEQLDSEEETWCAKNRRLTSFDHMEVFLPGIRSGRAREKSAIDIFLFLDTSGSCVHLADRFFKAARSIPTDRFNVHPFCFDTSVYEITLKNNKLYGFGGTSFSILEEYIQNMINSDKIKKYPDAIFVVTDGYGNNIKPAIPKRWHWFLSENYKNCIDPRCNTYNLKDFE